MKLRALVLAALLSAATVIAADKISPAKLIGKWQGGRHVTQFLKDGSYILDPDITPQPIRESVARWRLEGNRLTYHDAAGVRTYTIVSLTNEELVTKDEQGRTWRHTRVR